MKRAEIESAVLAQIARGIDPPMDDAAFDALALALFEHQFEHGEAYRRLCRALGVRAEDVTSWRDIPAVPTGAFKEARLATFPSSDDVRVFRTSGSSTASRGALHLDTLALYDASLLAMFSAYICPDVRHMRFAVLAPSADDAPDSSLSYMFDRVLRELGEPGSDFYASREGWDPERLLRDVGGLDEPVAVVGTAFAFVHWIDWLTERSLQLRLPPGSRAMETGGFKGRSREVPRAELHALISEHLGIAAGQIVNQYGMCELGSQFYEPSLRWGTPSRTKRAAPWVRTRVIDPASGEDMARGEVGALVHYDLANTGSVLAVQTSDAGRMVEDGFEVLGRLEGAEARGCSLAADALLAAK